MPGTGLGSEDTQNKIKPLENSSKLNTNKEIYKHLNVCYSLGILAPFNKYQVLSQPYLDIISYTNAPFQLYGFP